MPILRTIPIQVTSDQVLAAGGRQRVQSRFVRAAEGAIALGQTLWQPMAAYAWVDVHAVEGECVSVPGRDGEPVVLRVGPRADLLAPAQRILVSVATIGPALEETVRELDAGGDHLAAYLLDSAGVVAVGAVMEAVRCAAEEEAARLGWGVSASLSPGSLVGWPLEGQRELCALLPLDEIGVQLSAQCVLVPHKSASAAIGLGPGYQAHKVGSVCKFCALSGTCWRRRESPE